MNSAPMVNSGSGANRPSQPPRKAIPGRYDIPLATALVALVLGYVWTRRGDHILTAETGIGYWLGIAGSVMMLVLLLYPLRKRLRFMNRLGAVPGWFRLHMVLGVLGPGLVLVHTNFRLGSLNSQMALFSMLIVAGSGYVGRYLYYRIQAGLSGRKRSMVELRKHATQISSNNPQSTDTHDRLTSTLTEFERKHLGADQAFFTALYRALTGGLARKRLERALMRLQNDAQPSTAFHQGVTAYLRDARKAQKLVFYERLFSLWHLLHLPLFLILFVAAILHVAAVHLY